MLHHLANRLAGAAGELHAVVDLQVPPHDGDAEELGLGHPLERPIEVVEDQDVHDRLMVRDDHRGATPWDVGTPTDPHPPQWVGVDVERAPETREEMQSEAPPIECPGHAQDQQGDAIEDRHRHDDKGPVQVAEGSKHAGILRPRGSTRKRCSRRSGSKPLKIFRGIRVPMTLR